MQSQSFAKGYAHAESHWLPAVRRALAHLLRAAYDLDTRGVVPHQPDVKSKMLWECVVEQAQGAIHYFNKFDDPNKIPCHGAFFDAEELIKRFLDEERGQLYTAPEILHLNGILEDMGGGPEPRRGGVTSSTG